MKIAFFGTDNVALPVLEALNKNHQILAVITNPDAPVGRSKSLEESPVSALARDLKLKTLKPEKVKGNNQFFEELESLGADIFVVVAYGSILPIEIVNLPKFKTINIHFALLPKYRGPSPMQAALLNGDKQTGASIFVLDEQVDHGPLLAQKIVGTAADDNYFTLSDKLAKTSASLTLDILPEYEAGKITPRPQDDSAASYTKIISKEDGRINWQKSAGEIYNQFRAYFLWPGIWTKWKGKKLKITDCVVADASATLGPGTVEAGGVVACGNQSCLKIKLLQLEGKNETDITSFLNGYRDFVGSKLE